jgi:hypothetical protein
MNVICAKCKRTVGVDAQSFLRAHRAPGGRRCDGSGRHLDFNGPKEK